MGSGLSLAERFQRLEDGSAGLRELFDEVVLVTPRHRPITPKGLAQKRYIEAIRTLVRVASLRDRKRVFVDLANPSLTQQHASPRARRDGGEVTA